MPRLQLCKASECFARHPRSASEPGVRLWPKLRSTGFPHSFFDSRDKILHTKRLFQIEGADLAQSSYRFFIGVIAGNDHYLVDKVRTMFLNPGVNLSAIDATRRSHIRNHTEVLTFFEQAQGFGPGFDASNFVATTFKSGAHQSHDGGLVFDEKNWQGSGLESGAGHFCKTPAATPREAVCGAAGKRTMKVAPCPSVLLWQKISPPCSFTMP